MPETGNNNNFSSRLESKLDTVSVELKSLSDQVLRLTIINETQNNAAEANKKKLEILELEFSNLKSLSNQAAGSLSTLKWIMTFIGAALFSIVAWASSSIIESKQNISLAQAKSIRLESDIVELRAMMNQNERNRDEITR